MRSFAFSVEAFGFSFFLVRTLEFAHEEYSSYFPFIFFFPPPYFFSKLSHAPHHSILMIVTSFVITLFLMMAILSVIGPNEGEANVPFLIDWVKPKGFHSSVVAPSDSTTSAKNYEVGRFAS